MRTAESAPQPAIGEPLDLHFVDQEVVFLGPGNIAFSMTLSAAQRTSLRLGGLLAVIENSRKAAGG
jgi:hypothetical protein